MRVLVSGSSGLIGRALVRELRDAGVDAVRLVRASQTEAGAVRWDPALRGFDAGAAEGADAVVHLAGENIASRRWSDDQKGRIRGSRVDGTAFLSDRLAALERPPRVFVGASAVGFYGDTGDREVDESAGPGTDFLAKVCRDWEEASGPLRERGVRVVCLRIGVVLSGAGGALARMLPLFRLGLGGRVGSGGQWMSWIAIDDLTGVIRFALENARLVGPVNAVAPEPVRNAEFTKALARVLGRPAFVPAPAFALRLALGEMADALLLSSSRVVPSVLGREGFSFRHPNVEQALRSVLG
ncbi:MAG: TIGR01777 family oxidoreductase, partial [Candidatus Binatia bacterium]